MPRNPEEDRLSPEERDDRDRQMTQAPTPGPLDSESAKLLVKGDLLRVVDPRAVLDLDAVEAFDCEGHPDGFIKLMCKASHFRATRFVFIGRPSADGWMPWSGGENPVPGQSVQVRFTHNGETSAYKSEAWDWSYLDTDDRRHRIIAFRLAPTAPVEASGSELNPATADLVDRFAAELKSKLAKAEAKYGYAADWLKTDWQDELNESLAEHIQKGDPRDVAAYCAFAWHHGWSTSDALGHFAPKLHFQSSRERIAKCIRRAVGDAWIGECQAEVAADAVLNLRPQPSGETREQVALIIRQSGIDRGWAQAGDAEKLADRILTLSPAPVASGGQHSSGEGENG